MYRYKISVIILFKNKKSNKMSFTVYLKGKNFGGFGEFAENPPKFLPAKFDIFPEPSKLIPSKLDFLLNRQNMNHNKHHLRIVI